MKALKVQAEAQSRLIDERRAEALRHVLSLAGLAPRHVLPLLAGQAKLEGFMTFDVWIAHHNSGRGRTGR